MLKEYDRGAKKDKRQKETVLFIKQKIDAAKWFIDAIKQRRAPDVRGVGQHVATDPGGDELFDAVLGRGADRGDDLGRRVHRIGRGERDERVAGLVGHVAAGSGGRGRPLVPPRSSLR